MSEETVPKPRLNLQDCRNQDLVSRLLAATPPYLYSPPVGPHNFFFSEMLRSLVQAKTNEAVARSSTQQTQQVSIRRPRKRSWSNHRLPFETRKSTIDEKEKPLELTNKHSAFTSPKLNNNNNNIENCNNETTKVLSSPPPPPPTSLENTNKVPRLSTSSPVEKLNLTTENLNQIQSSGENLLSTELTSLRASSDLALPPAPPIWYPPLYHPPYGIDPLHFFIDLRVSGHIYDRKKENISPILRGTDNNNCTYLDTETLTKCRQNSAFSVPVPKDLTAINLTAPLMQDKKYLSPRSHEHEQMFDYFDSKDSNKTDLSKNTNYVLQNLPRIYTNLAPNKIDDNSSENEGKYNLNGRHESERKYNNCRQNNEVNRKETNFEHKNESNFSNDNDDDEPITIEEID